MENYSIDGKNNNDNYGNLFWRRRKKGEFFCNKNELPNFFLKIIINQKLLLNSLLFRALRRTKRELKKKKNIKVSILYVTQLEKLFWKIKERKMDRMKALIGRRSNLCLSLSSDERVPYLLKRDTTFKAVFRTHAAALIGRHCGSRIEWCVKRHETIYDALCNRRSAITCCWLYIYIDRESENK